VAARLVASRVVFSSTELVSYGVAHWSRHCATSQKVVGLRPDEVIDFYQFT
jgi:hypothetical protein